MDIDALVVDNFGLFRGKHEIVLTPRSPAQPVVLIGGLNGRGKTTILDAIQLALYGKRAQCSNRGSLGYKDYLKRCVHKGEKSTAIEIHLTTRSDGRESTLSVRRSWTSTASTGDALTVFRGGQRDEFLEESWDEFIEHLLPAGIAPLFFFDGEKIEKLADPATSREILTTAIHSLLGLDLIERLSTALRTIERSKKKDIAEDSNEQELDLLEEKINELSGQVDRCQQDLRDALRNAEDARISKEASEDRFRKEGGELIQNRLQLEQEERDLGNQIKNANERLIELSAGAAPLLLIESLLRSAGDQADREAAAAINDAIQQLLVDRDSEILRFLASTQQDDSEKIRLLDDYLKTDRETRGGSLSAPMFLEMPESARQTLRNFLSHGAVALRKEIHRSISSEEQVRDKLRLVEERLEAIPRDDSVADLKANREEARAAALRAQITADVIGEKLRDFTRALEHSSNKRRAEMEKNISARFANDSTRRIHDYSQKTRNVLESFGSALVRRNADKISAHVLDSLHQLLAKQKLVGGVYLDPNTFDVSLTDESGVPLSPDRLSAGERQLLAVAILRGLAQMSGRSLPTVIDTPLGRLDSSHRTNLVQNYFPRASHQVVLLSTDEEISETYYPMIKPSVGRSYLLTYDEETQSSSIKPGYFW